MFLIFFYLFSILVANWLVVYFGVIQFGPLVFPAGAVVVGLTFTVRDYMQRQTGKWGCWLWMMVAAALTYFLNPKVALASLTAFIVSEAVDWLIYSFSKLSFGQRVLLSNFISVPLDSVLFVSIAFGWLWQVVIGQTIIKFVSSILILIIENRK